MRRTNKLSAREAEVMRFYGSGMLVRDIATNMSLSKNSVSTYLSRAQRKLGGANRGELRIAAAALQPSASIGYGAANPMDPSQR